MTRILESVLTAAPWLVLLVSGGLVFAEAALFVGFVLPGETAAVLAGAAAKVGPTPLWAVLVTVIGCAVVGDSVGYEVGKHLGPKVVERPVLQRHRHRIEDAQAMLAARGGAAVFAARWTAFLRAVMPFLAGASGMAYRRFLPWNALGGATWGTTVVLVGYAAGASYQAAADRLGRIALEVLVVLVVAGLIAVGVRRRRSERAYEAQEPPE